MLSTIILITLFVGLLTAEVVLWALFLRVGLQWTRVEGATTGRIVLATVVITVLQRALQLLERVVASPISEAQQLFFGVAEIATNVLVACCVIRLIFNVHFLRALKAWLPTLLPSGAAVIFLLLVVRPFLYEAYVNPTNAMAPTLIGKHEQGACPQCGQPNFCSPSGEQLGSTKPSKMICENFHVSSNMNDEKRVLSADRFVVAKFFRPERWDLVVFHYPGDPSTIYVMRLVGLPGETIRIEDGSVWANVKQLTPPDSLRGIEYLSHVPQWNTDLWGSVNRPATLAEGEYFVLGDFSAQARDSRFWEQGAPGHHPFAVPESHFIGVATHIYWPPQRWRTLR